MILCIYGEDAATCITNGLELLRSSEMACVPSGCVQADRAMDFAANMPPKANGTKGQRLHQTPSSTERYFHRLMFDRQIKRRRLTTFDFMDSQAAKLFLSSDGVDAGVLDLILAVRYGSLGMEFRFLEFHLGFEVKGLVTFVEFGELIQALQIDLTFEVLWMGRSEFQLGFEIKELVNFVEFGELVLVNYGNCSLSSINTPRTVSFRAKLAAVAEELGREIRVFTTSTPITSEKAPATSISDSEEPDDFYEFTPEDYYRLLASKKEDKYLKTRKIREAEEAARRSRINKAVIRVRFPDNLTLEANFHPSEMVQSLVDLLMKVVARPDLPFYIYTTPPKKLITDMSQDFYYLGFAPGAIVYFSYDLPNEDERVAANSEPFLRSDIISLNGLDAFCEETETIQSAPESATVKQPSPRIPEPQPAVKKPVKPKWLRM
ncbi:Plant UBX domain-containing protein 1 [Asimina triloba]